jgi:hypothetical protein
METFRIVLHLTAVVTCLACAVLLLRKYRRDGLRMLLWSGLCFACLTLNNVLVFIDLLILPEVELRVARLSVALGGMVFLLYGFIWDSEL